jgi:hypothetical protein
MQPAVRHRWGQQQLARFKAASGADAQYIGVLSIHQETSEQPSHLLWCSNGASFVLQGAIGAGLLSHVAAVGLEHPIVAHLARQHICLRNLHAGFCSVSVGFFGNAHVVLMR